ncbi:glycosyltransferase [Clostridium sp. MCC353]|uniref:glycosyltransferase n=1 Tax=Clostridium sp. MCC353 TaxID=2592646 RepID=UPI001C0193FF|nr:glycosyltransferase [Clostridium sp. MCC353]MBT9778351.1 glycosyltransferase [Clostridium sp. MCC353]
MLNIIYFAPIPYEEMKQRPQYIAELLSKKNRVIYVEPTDTLMRCIIKRKDNYKGKKKYISETLTVIRLRGHLSVHAKLKLFDFFHLGTIYEKYQIREYLKEADVIWLGSESWVDVIRKDKTKILAYDKMDDNHELTKSWLIKKYLIKMERKLVDKADLIFVTSKVFYERFSRINKNVILMPNAVGEDQMIFKVDPVAKTEKKRIGYLGVVSHWVDLDAIRLIAENNLDYEIAIIGPNYCEEIKLPNVIYYGQVEKKEVPSWIASFDICLYPFKMGKLADTIDPVKIYEYLAANKPVIAVQSVEMEKFASLLYTYKNYDEMLRLCRDKLLPPFKCDEDLQRFFKENSWNNRVEHIESILTERKILQ